MLSRHLSGQPPQGSSGLVDGPAQNVRVGPKLALPVAVTDDGDRVSSGPQVIALRNQPATPGSYAEQLEVIPSNQIPPDARILAAQAHVHGHDPNGRHMRKG